MAKTIAVLGGGNGAHALAADMALQGHRVRMFYRRQESKVFHAKRILVTGIIEGGARLELVTADIEEAVCGADYIFLITPAYAHDTYAAMLKGLLSKEQMLLVFPGAFASLQFRNAWGDDNCPIILEANNLPYGARLIEEDKVAIYNRNSLNVAFMPAEIGPSLLQSVRTDIAPIVINRVLEDILACGLSLLNPVSHAGSCLVNISNIERPDVDFFLYEHGFTPSAAKLSLALDRERIALARALGYELHPVSDNNGLPLDYTWEQLYMSVHGNISHTIIRGPNDIQNRYLTEDTPYGLVPWAAIARLAGVPMPVSEAIIQLYSVIHGKDWNQEGLSDKKLGLDHFTPSSLATFLKTGRRS